MLKQLKEKQYFLVLVLLIVAVVFATFISGFADTAPVSLNSISEYAIFAGSAISNTGNTKVSGENGDAIGMFSGAAITERQNMITTGVFHLSDSMAKIANDDLLKAYEETQDLGPATLIASELGGQTLKSGVYASNNGTFTLDGILILDGQDDPNAQFVFQMTSDLTTEMYSQVVLRNQAKYNEVLWQVGDSAILGANSRFVGRLMADSAITVGNKASVQGQILALNGAIILDTNTIINGVLSTLNVITKVVNVSNGQLTPSDFSIYVKPLGSDLVVPASDGIDSPGKVYVLPAGIYNVTEDPESGYFARYTADNDYSGNVTLNAGDNKTITIINYDTPQATVTVPVTPVIPVTPPVVTIVPPLTPLAPPVVTVTGGELPATATPWYNLLLIGLLLTVVGGSIWKLKRN